MSDMGVERHVSLASGFGVKEGGLGAAVALSFHMKESKSVDLIFT